MPLEIRKIGTKEEAERKSRRNTLILSIIMISILVLSTAGYFSMRDNGTSTNTGSDKVQNVGDSWIINYNGESIRLSSSPESTKNVSVVMFSKLESYAGKSVYVASDYDGGFYEVGSAMQNYVGRIQQACYGKCNKDLPEKNCTDTMIVISELNNSAGGAGRVYEQDNCVFIEGGLNAVDAFLYHIFGVN
jgi:hypothetical protein